MRRGLLFGVIVTIVAMVTVSCGGDDSGSSGAGSDGSSVTLTASNFLFEPADVTASSGDVIEFVNEDDAEHNITAEEAGIDTDVDAGGSTTVDLGGVGAGTYAFFCEFHPDAMTGELTITG